MTPQDHSFFILGKNRIQYLVNPKNQSHILDWKETLFEGLFLKCLSVYEVTRFATSLLTIVNIRFLSTLCLLTKVFRALAENCCVCNCFLFTFVKN